MTCEENYEEYYGEIIHLDDGSETLDKSNIVYFWEHAGFESPKHFGWVVEIDPISGIAEKHIALGRFAHEGARVTRTQDGRLAVYMGDDKADECFYKFISDRSDSLATGTLYVANTQLGKWIALDINQNVILQQHFHTQQEVMIHCRKAAKLYHRHLAARQPFSGCLIIPNDVKGNKL